MVVSLSAMFHDWTACDGLIFANVTETSADCVFCGLTVILQIEASVSGLFVLALLLHSGLCLICDSEQIGILDMGQRILQ